MTTVRARRPLRRLVPLLAALPLALTAACASGSAATPAAGTGEAGATLQTAFGEVTAPADPQRVVALGDTALDTALALGVTPVGTLSSRGGTTVSAYLADRAGDVPLVGTVRETDLEAVVGADPDLVLAAAGTTQAQYDALRAIAPTVVPAPTAYGAWEDEVRAFAAALGREEKAEQLLTDIEQRAAALAERAGSGGTAAVVRWMPTGPLVMSSSLMAGRLVEAAGRTLPDAADFTDKPHTDALSLENLGLVDAGRIYVATLNADGQEALAAAQAQPAFARLEAAKAGEVVAVDGSVWTSGAGPIAAQRVLDDIERAG